MRIKSINFFCSKFENNPVKVASESPVNDSPAIPDNIRNTRQTKKNKNLLFSFRYRIQTFLSFSKKLLIWNLQADISIMHFLYMYRLDRRQRSLVIDLSTKYLCNVFIAAAVDRLRIHSTIVLVHSVHKVLNKTNESLLFSNIVI